jgi:anhydro-N-acetylmuramic acid kinase
VAKKKLAGKRLAAGLISGTSMDGVDAALVEIRGPAEWPRVRVRAFLTMPYKVAEREAIARVASGGPTSASAISQLNFLLGELFADAALAVCRRGRISPKRLTVIGSHGQTIYHQGIRLREAGRQIASTLQIAEPAVIAQRTGAPVVSDFRTADMAAGGQGAPLVPIVDYLLLRDVREGRVALNIGGIANLTVIPAAAKPDQVFGFDTGPGNMVMDALVRKFTHGRKSFDPGGAIASTGRFLDPILIDSLKFPFFSRKPPKSAGREQFGAEFMERYYLGPRRGETQDLLRTAVELTARTIAGALEQFVLPRVTVKRLIVSGGGARNNFLMQRLSKLLPEMKVELSDRYGLPVDAKEAIAFALLADRTMHGLPGNLPAVTGARRAVVLGAISRP